MPDYTPGSKPYLAVRIIEGARPRKRELVDFAQWALGEHEIAEAAIKVVQARDAFLRAFQAGEGPDVTDRFYEAEQAAQVRLMTVVHELTNTET